MGYDFTVKGAVRPKKDGEYPWPCASEPDRTITLYDDDVLTRQDNGKYLKHTGLGCMNIMISDEEVEPWGEDKRLRLL